LDQGLKVENFGSYGFNSRQGLAKLINLYTRGETLDYVIFYDGVNDVALCRSELNEFEHLRAYEYSENIDHKKDVSSWRSIPYAISYIFLKRTIALAENLHKRLIERPNYRILHDCHIDHQKSVTIAKSLIENWKIAKKLVTAHGGTFIAFLQPNAFIGKPNLKHIEGTPYLESYMAKQYETVYPEIQKIIEQENIDWIYDISDAFDNGPQVYLDFCHVINKGNSIIADRVYNYLKPVMHQNDSTKP